MRDRLFTLALFLVGSIGALSYALAQPAYSTGDEMAHVDYAYQLWHGDLPRFEDGLVLDPGVGFRPDVQWVSQHPPLFYAALAPVVGPLVDAGHPIAADLAARGLLIVLAGLAVLAVRWCVRAAWPDQPGRATIAALVFGLASWLPRQGGAVYNDLPAIVLLTLATGWLFRALRAPGARLPVVAMVGCVCAAVLIRFSAAPIGALLVAVLAAHRLLALRRPGTAVAEAAAAGVAVVATSGWWWWHNLQVTGSLQGSQADYFIEVRGRTTRTLADVVLSDFWFVMAQQFFSTYFMESARGWTVLAWVGIVVLLLVPAVAGTASALREARRERDPAERWVRSLVLVTLLGTVGIIVATQIAYCTTSGSALPRYFFAMVPALAALMACAFDRSDATRRLLVGWVVVRCVALGPEVWSIIHRERFGPQADFAPTGAWIATTVVTVLALVLALALAQSPRPGPRPARRGVRRRAPGDRRSPAA